MMTTISVPQNQILKLKLCSKLTSQFPHQKVYQYVVDTYNLYLFNIYMFTDPMVKIKAFKSLIAELEEFVAHDKEADHIDHINAHLYNAVLSCRVIKSANFTNTCPSFASKENIAPGQKQNHNGKNGHVGIVKVVRVKIVDYA